MSVQQPHDTLFKTTFRKKEQLVALLKALLTPQQFSLIDWRTLRFDPASFADEHLTSEHSDILVSVRLLSKSSAEPGVQVFLFLVLEHQSSNDAMMVFRVLSYMVQIWKRYLEQNASSTRLPLVLPVVVAHTEQGWTSPVRFRDLFGLTEQAWEAYRENLPEFEFKLDDLHQSTDETLRQRHMTPLATLTLAALRELPRGKDLADWIVRWAPEFRALQGDSVGEAQIRTLARYILAVQRQFSATEVETLMTQSVGNTAAQAFRSTADDLIDQGVEVGVWKIVTRQFERKLGRALSEEERATLKKRVDPLGPERLGDVALDLDGPALEAWLKDPNAT